MPKKCHICGNVAFNSENYVRCSNVRQSLANGRPICTRVICRDCHDDYGWDFHAAMAEHEQMQAEQPEAAGGAASTAAAGSTAAAEILVAAPTAEATEEFR